VLIMTSNIGSDIISGTRRSVGFGTADAKSSADEELRDRLDRRLREQLRPEFINRIDEIIVFRQLETDQLRQITELMLQETRHRLTNQGISLEISPEAVDWLADRGFQPEFGARPLRRTIQRELDNRLSKLLLSSDLKPGQTVKVDVADGKLTFA
jgi:ATP-dependent Clp protease ATP-binding subunit ClpC